MNLISHFDFLAMISLFGLSFLLNPEHKENYQKDAIKNDKNPYNSRPKNRSEN